ncbi:MAG: TolC family protein, partial [Bacteroidia bacterium]|nr:TolC family protein [Bacteroidia bacterium]
MKSDTKIILTDTLNPATFQMESENLATEPSYNKRIEFKLLQMQQTLNGYDVKRHKAGYYPSIGAFAGVSTQALRNRFDFYDTKQRWFPTVVLGIRINVPIFDGLQRHQRLEQAKLAIIKTDNDLKNLRQAIDLEVKTAQATLNNALLSMQAQKKTQELAAEVLRLSKLKYEKGTGSNLEVITAESEYKQAQINYINSMLDAILAKIELQKANGTLYNF